MALGHQVMGGHLAMALPIESMGSIAESAIKLQPLLTEVPLLVVKHHNLYRRVVAKAIVAERRNKASRLAESSGNALSVAASRFASAPLTLAPSTDVISTSCFCLCLSKTLWSRTVDQTHVQRRAPYSPKGSFVGDDSPALKVPHKPPKEGVQIFFDLKEEVPLEWVLRLADALQGYEGLDGKDVRGILMRPDPYEWYTAHPELADRPWAEACVANYGFCPFVDFKIEAGCKDDADKIEAVLQPRVSRLKRFEGERIHRKIKLM